MSQRTAVITGAAGGLGRALAAHLAAQGYALALADVNAERLNQVCRELETPEARVFAIPTDVSSADAVEALCVRSFEALGHVDLLINNAGVLVSGNSWEIAPEVWQRTLNINLWSVVHAHRAFVPRLLAQGSGHIVNVASMAGIAVGPYLAPYTVSKQGVVSLTETLALEIAAAGLPLKVSVVCPGPVATGIASGLTEASAAGVAQMNGFLRAGIEGGTPAEAVAERILTGVAAGDFWILPHPEAADAATRRAAGIAGNIAPALPW
ncbi:short-chain dehydrogenase [Pandoraea terrae]|uniref:Short-chain dehydrogenase n=1 Tax=Pandoraea terrae TaxID=1537710 RepID=A0A5E4ZC91_9BURK|nr:SDR family NAD(P)-dependent oxidoreductase [Pandoraea terrae]VVE58458.1 short-chain dehydrogenase [Pandoraea terrae]